MKKTSNEDFNALMNSEVYREFEKLMLRKQADNLADKIVNSPAGQQAIKDSISKALSGNSADDKDDLESHLKQLTDKQLLEVCKLFVQEAKTRGLDICSDGEQSADEEDKDEDSSEEEPVIDSIEEDLPELLAYVKESLVKIAYKAADEGDTHAAYLIERFIEQL